MQRRLLNFEVRSRQEIESAVMSRRPRTWILPVKRDGGNFDFSYAETSQCSMTGMNREARHRDAIARDSLSVGFEPAVEIVKLQPETRRVTS